MSRRLDVVTAALGDAIGCMSGVVIGTSRVARPLALVALGALAELELEQRDALATKAFASMSNTGGAKNVTYVTKTATVESSIATAPVTQAGETPGSPADLAPDDVPAVVEATADVPVPPAGTSAKTYTCTVCGYVAKSAGQLGGHQHSHRGKVARSYPAHTEGLPTGIRGYGRGCRCRDCCAAKSEANRRQRKPVPVVPARERPEKPVEMPAPPDVEPDTTYRCEHCAKAFGSLSACAAHETSCGRTGSPVAPLPDDGLVLACSSCDWRLAADLDRAEALLATHTHSAHARFPTADEQRKRSAA
jgi:hypothetical protein